MLGVCSIKNNYISKAVFFLLYFWLGAVPLSQWMSTLVSVFLKQLQREMRGTGSGSINKQRNKYCSLQTTHHSGFMARWYTTTPWLWIFIMTSWCKPHAPLFLYNLCLPHSFFSYRSLITAAGQSPSSAPSTKFLWESGCCVENRCSIKEEEGNTRLKIVQAYEIEVHQRSVFVSKLNTKS